MNLQEYISSGIIESYVLGMASDKERLEFERLAKKYPELIMIRNDFELSLEHEALVNAVAPPAYVKEEIFARIRLSLQIRSTRGTP